MKLDVRAADEFEHCVHCGLCLPQCPTYQETANENESPRGRIYLLEALHDDRLAPSPATDRHLASCLDCRACESACPSGVEYGRLIESYRQTRYQQRRGPQSWLERALLTIMPHPRRVEIAHRALRLAVAIGAIDFLRHSGLADRFGLDALAPEALAELQMGDNKLPVQQSPDSHVVKAKVGFFTGCVNAVLLSPTNRATWRVLLRNGCAVRCPRGESCCGALHYHAGDIESARAFARKTINTFDDPHCETVIVNAAGCGLMLKDYGELLRDDAQYASRAEEFSARVRDIHEFLVDLPLDPPKSSLTRRVAYDDACHLCHGQGIRSAPREVLGAISGVTLAALPNGETCCGAAGSYSILQPRMAARLGRKKIADIASTGVRVVATGNVGCILHLRQAARAADQDCNIIHPIDLLDEAYGLENNSPY
jgi:glycolate oxidase iron-sulfur subunit